MQIMKKIINLANGTNNSDAVNFSQLINYLRIDGKNKMVSFIDMNSNRIQNCAPRRHGTADVMTHIQFEIFYLYLNVDSGKIEVKNNIDMKRIFGLPDAVHHSDSALRSSRSPLWKLVPLSLLMISGLPLLAINLRRASMNEFVSKECEISMWTALEARQVKKHP